MGGSYLLLKTTLLLAICVFCRRTHYFDTLPMVPRKRRPHCRPPTRGGKSMPQDGCGIQIVKAKRMINCKTDCRGAINELVVRNYLTNTIVTRSIL